MTLPQQYRYGFSLSVSLGLLFASNMAFAELPVISTPNATDKPAILNVVQQQITVNGKKSTVFDIVQPNGTKGFVGEEGQYFNVMLKNKTKLPMIIHWHGLLLPNNQDGIPYVTQLPIPAGGEYHYDYPLVQSGTYWMHSHFGFQEQQMMSAPFIIENPKSRYKNATEVVMFVEDFSFKKPEKIFAELRHADKKSDSKPMAMNMKNMDMKNMSGMKMDLNDVKYDAYLTNRRTLNHPDIISVTPGEQVRLRIINGSSASNMWINTGRLEATAIALDGQHIKPYKNEIFQLPMAERLDVLVTIPKGEGAYPILGFPEGTNNQTGLILATSGAKIPRLSETTKTPAPALNNQQDMTMKALHPLPEKPIDQTLTYVLSGNMQKYIWTINGEVWPHIKPLEITQGERVAMVFVNNTGMAHPMHLHGHFFEAIDINGTKIKDAPFHDTILVMPLSKTTVVFDADNPGIWMMHCHVLYHMAAGMMTTINYKNYPAPKFYEQLIGKIPTTKSEAAAMQNADGH